MKPVAWYDPSNGAVSTDKNSPLFTPLGQVWPLFSQRPWVGLTDEEMAEIWEDGGWYVPMFEAIEAKLKEKNL
jgi:hypothetical protein